MHFTLIGGVPWTYAVLEMNVKAQQMDVEVPETVDGAEDMDTGAQEVNAKAHKKDEIIPREVLLQVLREKRGVDVQITETWFLESSAYVHVRFNDERHWVCKFLCRDAKDHQDQLEREDTVVSVLRYVIVHMSRYQLIRRRKKTLLPIPQSHGIVQLDTDAETYFCLLNDLFQGVTTDSFFPSGKVKAWQVQFYRQRQFDALRATAKATILLARHQSTHGGPVVVSRHNDALEAGGHNRDPPYTSAEAFYCDMVRRNQEEIDSKMVSQVPGSWEECLGVLRVFLQILPCFVNDDSRFYLGHPDLGGESMIFDWQGNFKALVDCAYVSYFPLHWILQPPGRLGLDFIAKTRVDPKDNRKARARPYTEYAGYAGILRDVARLEGEEALGEHLSANLLSPGTMAVRILYYASLGDRQVCQTWLNSPDVQALWLSSLSISRFPVYSPASFPNLPPMLVHTFTHLSASSTDGYMSQGRLMCIRALSTKQILNLFNSIPALSMEFLGQRLLNISDVLNHHSKRPRLIKICRKRLQMTLCSDGIDDNKRLT